MRASSTNNRAFTLIELLTVIAIIAVLVGLLFPAIKSALLKAEKSKAQAAIVGLETAFKAYYTEYGRWPIFWSIPTNGTLYTTAPMVGLLRGEDVSGLIGSVNYLGNPR